VALAKTAKALRRYRITFVSSRRREPGHSTKLNKHGLFISILFLVSEFFGRFRTYDTESRSFVKEKMRKNLKKITPEGKRLKILLKQEGIKQKEFAKLIGMAPSSVSDFMHGRMKGGGGIKFWDGIRAAFPNWENKIRDDVRIPPESSKSGPGSTNGTKGIVICGYQFRDRKIAVKCVNLLWNLDQLSSELFNHGQMCLQMLLDGANIMVKKIKNQI